MRIATAQRIGALQFRNDRVGLLDIEVSINELEIRDYMWSTESDR
jgi:hypothetical protein